MFRSLHLIILRGRLLYLVHYHFSACLLRHLLIRYVAVRCLQCRAVFVVGPTGRPVRPRKQHNCHHDTKVKPEAATAVIELLMMGGKTPETC
jgi:hypothetical protein